MFESVLCYICTLGDCYGFEALASGKSFLTYGLDTVGDSDVVQVLTSKECSIAYGLDTARKGNGGDARMSCKCTGSNCCNTVGDNGVCTTMEQCVGLGIDYGIAIVARVILLISFGDNYAGQLVAFSEQISAQTLYTCWYDNSSKLFAFSKGVKK